MANLLKPASMKLFYLTFPSKYEDTVIEEVGSLGVVQPIKEYAIKGFSKVDNIEVCERYIKLQQRINTILSTIIEDKQEKKSLISILKSVFRKTVIFTPPRIQTTLNEIERVTTEVESQLDIKLDALDKIQSEIESLRSLREKASLIKKYGMKITDVGDFEHLFVKVGFLNNEFLPKLERYAVGTSVKYFGHPERKKESFIVVTGLQEDKPHIEEALTLLNFDEVVFPEGLNPEPQKVLSETEETIGKKEKEAEAIKKEVQELTGDFIGKTPSFEPLIRKTLGVEEARSSVSRTQTLSLMHGWIPEKNIEPLKEILAKVTDGASFIKVEDPTPKDNPPVKLENKGVFSNFDLLIRLRGIPDYFEIDPTPITTILFTIMFGMMFGDVGQGGVLVVIGFIFNRLGKGFLGIPGGAIKKLGGIMVICGLSSMVFGAFYGEVFLFEAFHPLLISPMHDQMRILVIALIFGVIQMILGLVLNMVNELRRKNMIGAVLGGHGLIALLYYIGGVMLAIRFSSNMNLNVFMENLTLTIIVMGALIIIFLSPLLEGFIEGKVNLVDSLLMGFSHAIETFIAFLTNSVSYVRLAAFALAHSALGLSALILAGQIGFLPSFILLNILVILIEGMSTLIQSMRLTYYEFFTKFYSGGGAPYRPFIMERA